MLLKQPSSQFCYPSPKAKSLPCKLMFANKDFGSIGNKECNSLKMIRAASWKEWVLLSKFEHIKQIFLHDLLPCANMSNGPHQHLYTIMNVIAFVPVASKKRFRTQHSYVVHTWIYLQSSILLHFYLLHSNHIYNTKCPIESCHGWWSFI